MSCKPRHDAIHSESSTAKPGDLVRVRTSWQHPKDTDYLYIGLVLDVIHDDNLDPGIYKLLRNYQGTRIIEWIDVKGSTYVVEKLEPGGDIEV